MNHKTFTVVLDSDVLEINRVIKSALEFLTGVFRNLTEEAAFEIRLLLSEALQNAIKHGNDEDNSKKVTLSIKAFANKSISIQINDEGVGFDHAAVLTDSSVCGLLSETGRGVRLVKLLSNGVSYNEKGNKIKIYKKVDTDG